MQARGVDKPFLAIVLALVLLGFFIFSSASLGLLAREGLTVSSVMANQLLGLAVGFVLMFIAARVPFRVWNKYAFYIFIAGLVITAFVFIPGLGFEHGGARRWLNIGSFSFQPSELLKMAFVVYYAAWLAGIRDKVKNLAFGPLPLVITLVLSGGLLIAQPDLDTVLVMALAGLAMLVAAGGRWLHIFALCAAAGALLIGLSFIFPYVETRLLTFLHPSADALGAGYQIQQSLIAIGSGGLFGRGFGQSIQKFSFLPEPVGDSIFAVYAEEWGFVGALVLIILFILFAMRGLRIAHRAPTTFSSLVTIGIVLMFTVQSFINMAAMLGIFPLTGMPLIFVSQGGSALMVALAGMGIILNISRYQTSAG